jgi:hypothetical protein
VFHNKQDEHGVVTRNKARLVVKGYSHSSKEEEDDHETFKIHSPIERTNLMPLKYSKKTTHRTINGNSGAPMYDGNQ